MSKEYLYFKFSGPLADDGLIDIEKSGKTLLALNKWFKKYTREVTNSQETYILRVGDVKKGSSEIDVFIEIAKEIAGLSSHIIIAGALTKNLGIREFITKFMGTLGEQLALKVFSKGEALVEERRFTKKQKAMVKLKNTAGKSHIIDVETWQQYQKLHTQLNGICNLEKHKEEKMDVGYFDTSTNKKIKVASLTHEDQPYFYDYTDPDVLAKRLHEPFDEERAEKVTLIGQFVEYHGMAHKYYFSFQVRRKQSEYGKQKILCVVETNFISDILDLLKPENIKNVYVQGMATRDREGRLDKMKVEWFSHDPNYNPNQTTIDSLH